jgi:hypothetical protein
LSNFPSTVTISEEAVPARQSLNGKAFTRQYMTILERVSPGRKWREPLKAFIAKCEACALQTNQP